MPISDDKLYETALEIVDSAVGSGPYSINELVLAYEMRKAISYVSEHDLKRNSTRKILRERGNVLFLAACEVMHESAGACSPADAAKGIVMSFIRCGMDMEKTMKFAKTRLFAEMKL